MTKRTPEERREQHQARANKATGQAAVYRAKESAYRVVGKIDKADKAGATARDFELNASTHLRAIEELDASVRRQHRLRDEATKVAAPRILAASIARATADREEEERRRRDPLKIYMEAQQHASELDAEVARYRTDSERYEKAGDQAKSERAAREANRRQQWAVEWREKAQQSVDESGRDLARERKVALKAKHRQDAASAKESARLKDLGLVEDVRTVGGSREYVAGGVRKGRIVSMAEYGTLFRRPEDRTQARVDAMHDFDNLCGTAESGLFPEPKFEHESGGGKGPGALVMEKRAAGLEEMSDLRDALGSPNVDMLRARIYERQTLTALVRAGYGTETTVAQLFLSAVDSMVVFFKTRNALAARLAGIATNQAPKVVSPRAQASAARR